MKGFRYVLVLVFVLGLVAPAAAFAGGNGGGNLEIGEDQTDVDTSIGKYDHSSYPGYVDEISITYTNNESSSKSVDVSFAVPKNSEVLEINIPSKVREYNPSRLNKLQSKIDSRGDQFDRQNIINNNDNFKFYSYESSVDAGESLTYSVVIDSKKGESNTLGTWVEGSFAGGSGSSGDPYQITTCSEWQSINASNNYYELQNDIDCGGTDLSGIVTSKFSGHIYGQDYTVSNFGMSASGNPMFSANVAGNTDNPTDAEIKNIQFADIQDWGSTEALLTQQIWDQTNYTGITIRDSQFSDPDYRFGLIVNEFEGGTIEDITLKDLDITNNNYGVFGITYGHNTGSVISDVTVSNVTFDAAGSSSLIRNGNTITDVLVEDSYFKGSHVAYGSLESGTVRRIEITNSTAEGTASDEVALAAAGYNPVSVKDFDIEDSTVKGSAGEMAYVAATFNTGTSIEDGFVGGSSIINGANNDFMAVESGSSASITDSYWDTEQVDDDGQTTAATGLTTSEMQGDSASDNMAFDFSNIWSEVINPDDYPVLLTNVISPPQVDVIKPISTTEYEDLTVDFESDVTTSTDESATVEMIVESPSGTNTTIYSTSQSADTTVTHTTSESFSETGNYSWWTYADTTEHDVYDSGNFTVEEYHEPKMNQDYPSNNSVVEWDVWNNPDGYSFKFQFDINISESMSSADWTVYHGQDGGKFSFETGSISGDVQDVQTDKNFSDDVEVTDYRWDIEVNDGTSTVEDSAFFNITKVNIPPSISSFTVDPSISSVSAGDTFDLSVDGSPGSDPHYDIDSITYSMSVTNNADPADVVVDPDYQDSSQYNDKQTDAFEVKDSYLGENITLSVKVQDTNGRYVSTSTTDTTSVPPNGFNLNSPTDGENFLTPEGSNTVDVDIDYGVNTDNHEGTAELLVNGNVKDSFSIPENSNQSQIFTDSYTDGDYTWKVRFNDSVTGDSYVSGTKGFTVSDTPFVVDLQSPSQQTIDIVGADTTDVDHNFEIDARATNKNYYYKFTLENSSNSVVASRTSQDLDTGIQSFTETVQSLGEDDYQWSVDVYFSSDDTLQESATTSYTINKNPKFDQRIKDPLDSEKFELLGATSIDINSSYEVTAYETDVSSTLLLDGSQVYSNTTSAGTTETFEYTLQDVPEGSHTLTLNSEDGDGRTTTSSVDFEVVDEKNFTFRKVEAQPSLSDAHAEDSIDVYFEGVNQSKIDKVEIKVLVNGTEEKTVVIPSDEIRAGSFFGTAKNIIERAGDYFGSTVEIIVTAFNDAGDTVSDALPAQIIGDGRDPAVGLERPNDEEVFEQVNGTSENIPFKFKVTTASQPVDWELHVNGSMVEYGQINDTDTSTTVSEYIDMEDDLAYKQFGSWDWKVKIDEENTAYNTSSITRSYSVIEETDEPVLNFNSPTSSDIFEITGEYDTYPVPFNADWEAGETGTVTIEVDGSTVFEATGDSGSFNDQVDIPVGVYDANMTFSSENYHVSKIRTFSVERNLPDTTVNLRSPEDGDTAYKGSATEFSWRVLNANESGTTWMEVTDQNGNIVDNYTRQYNTQYEKQVYREISNTEYSVGDYNVKAYLETDSGIRLDTESWTFTVADNTEPEKTPGTPKAGEIFDDSEKIDFNWTVKTFEQGTQVKLKIREKGEVNYDTLYSSAQDPYSTDQHSRSKQLEKGTYEYIIETDTNPVFQTEPIQFTVESSDIQDAEIYLDTPRQDEKYETGNDSDTALVEFNYSAEAFSDTDADVKLRLETVEDGEGQGFKTVDSALQNVDDGNVSYNVLKNLSENGYRYKIIVEYQNGESFESDVRSFAVGDSDVPIPNPADSIIDRGSNLISSLNNTYKGAVGDTGQFFTASLLILGISGLIHLMFGVDLLTTLSAILMTLGFSIADGYLPLATFYIVLAVSAFMAAYLGSKWYGGDS